MKSDFQIPFATHTPPRLHHCEPGWAWSPPALVDFDFWAVLAGEGNVDLNAARHPLRPGTVFLLRPGDRVSANHNPKEPLRVFAFHFMPGEAFPWDPLTLPKMRQITDLADLQHLSDSAVRLSHPVTSGEEFRLSLTLLQLLALFTTSPGRLQPGAGERLQDVAQRMLASPGTTGSIADLAASIHLSPSHFTREFRKRFGSSPKQFLDAARAQRAAELLRESPLTLEEIASAAGYNDVFHFSKRFRQQKGLPPAAYRKKKRSASISNASLG